jgi:tetratricopeptide (TPR) repeat protein
MRAVLVGAAMAALVCAGSAKAATTVLGNGLAHICSESAKAGSDDPRAVDVCSMAIESESLTRRDLAGTYVNRGVLKMRRKGFRDAHGDFNIAIKLAPTMGEAFVNRGGALLGERRYAEALADIDRGLTLNPEEPEKAYYNRALANEGLDDMKAAYLDYMKALELAPNWDAPRHELARFTVQNPTTGQKASALENAPPAPTPPKH